jgi:membrane-bound lytic murein transglycosylase MltF
MRNIAHLSAIIFVVGCADVDLRVNNSSLEPTGTAGEYRWRTIADAIYPESSKEAEAIRIEQLHKVMMLNSACAKGYEIKDRAATRKSQGALGDIYDIFYIVQCD